MTNSEKKIPEVLIVEDSEPDRYLLAMILNAASSYHLSFASNGEEALSAINNKIPDLLLLDVSLPDMSGFDICLHIKENPLSKNIPVIFLSGLVDAEDKIQGFSCGAVDYITKPFNKEELVTRINTHINAEKMRIDLGEYAETLRAANEALRLEIRERINVEKVLKKNQKLLNETSKMAKVGGWEFNAKTMETEVTEEVYNIFEADLFSLKKVDDWLIFFTKDSRFVMEKAIQSALESGKSSDMEVDIVTAKGNPRCIHLIGQVSSFQEQVEKVFGTVQDITSTKSLFKKANESEERFRTLFNSSIDAIMTLEPPDWRFTSGNPATVKMFGAKDESDFISYEPWRLSPELQPDGLKSEEKAKDMISTAMQKGFSFFEW